LHFRSRSATGPEQQVPRRRWIPYRRRRVMSHRLGHRSVTDYSDSFER
jgi:hypothetical protein